MFSVSIILVSPQIGENIGAVARVMSNFSLTDLIIVSPRDGWPPCEQAYKIAAGGISILKNAKVYNNLEEAVADLTYLIGSTARKRFMEKDTASPKIIINDYFSLFHTDDSKDHKLGIMFGRENNGLTNEELAICDVISTIPTSDSNSSLNLAQAVAIFAYEYMCNIIQKQANNLEKLNHKKSNLAAKESIIHLFEHLESELHDKNFFKIPEMQKNMMLNIKNIFSKAQLTEQEVRTLRGIIKTLSS